MVGEKKATGSRYFEQAHGHSASSGGRAPVRYVDDHLRAVVELDECFAADIYTLNDRLEPTVPRRRGSPFASVYRAVRRHLVRRLNVLLALPGPKADEGEIDIAHDAGQGPEDRRIDGVRQIIDMVVAGLARRFDT